MKPQCLCPHCGKKWESNRLDFDFTGFIRDELKEILGKDNQNKQVLSEHERFFNKHQFYHNEDNLWDLLEVKDAKVSPCNKKVIYSLPMDDIEKEAVNDKMDDFVKELQKNKEKIREKKYTLLLLKGNGNDKDDEIRISMVRNADTGEAIADVRQCPECHGIMSYWAGRYEEISLTVLGGPRVSKSTTLTACVAAFRQSEGNICWDGADEDESWQFFKKYYLEPYERGKKIMPTETGDKAKIPKVSFRVTINGKKIILTFIDLPGEFDGHKGIDDAVYKKYELFYNNVDFVWYCTDPAEVMQLEGTAQNSQALKELGYADKQEIIKTDKLASNMRVLAGFLARGKSTSKVPVIYILGKSDAKIIADDDKEKYGLYLPGETDICEPLDIKQFYEQARKVKEYMKKYNSKLVRTFEENFEYHSYMAISAYGYAPEDTDERQREPYHCTLPFYWMLALKSYIDVKLAVTTRRFWRTQSEDFVDKLENLPEDVREKAERNLCMCGSYRL